MNFIEKAALSTTRQKTETYMRQVAVKKIPVCNNRYGDISISCVFDTTKNNVSNKMA